MGNTGYTIFDSTKEVIQKKYKAIEMILQTILRTLIKQPKNTNRFYPRVMNKSNIEITNYELTLFNEVLKYNLNHKQKYWIKTFALEAETAITQLPRHEQDHIHYKVAHYITRLYKQNKRNTQIKQHT